MMFFPVLAQLGCDLLRFVVSMFRSSAAILAENIALRASSEVCVRCHHPRRRLPDPKKVVIVLLDRLFGVRNALVLISPATVRRWAKKITTLAFWLRARCGRRPVPAETIALIRRLARENPVWSVRRIASEASTHLGILVSPETVQKYLPLGDPRRSGPHRPSSEKWSAFIHNHAHALLAIDFAVERTLFGGILYVLVVMEIGSRRILHTNVTAHPTAEWTAQQLRQAIPAEHGFTHLIHDNDAIFSRAVDTTIRSFAIEPLRTPLRSPRANAYCERLIGTLRRECLDRIIAVTEAHLGAVVSEWAAHNNRARPHMSLGYSVPEPSKEIPAPPLPHRHRLPPDARVVSRSVLGGLHHEYRFEKLAA